MVSAQRSDGIVNFTRRPSHLCSRTPSPSPSPLKEMDSGILQRRLNAVERPSIAGYSVICRLDAADCCNTHTSALRQLRLTDAEESTSGSNLSR